MNLLLDTNVLLWTLSSPERLTRQFANWIESPSNKVCVSSLTLWEIVTKVQIGKLQMLDDLPGKLEQSGISMLDFKDKDAIEIFNLPLHHRDPFDRGLLAQARRNQLRFLTSDALLANYGSLVDIQVMN